LLRGELPANPFFVAYQWFTKFLGRMVFLCFTEWSSEGKIQKFMLGAHSIEASFEWLSRLVKMGCQPLSIQLDWDTDRPIKLPVEAFDGESMKEPLQHLSQQLEEILCQP
jgi:hypothetical protein